MIKDYISITKPGIIRANLVTAAAAYLFASDGNVSWLLLFNLLIGTTLVIASAAIANNIIDIDIDLHMQRTKNRSIASGRVPTKNAAFLSFVMLAIGFSVLYGLVNPLSAYIGLVAHLAYTFVYGYYKRRSVHGTLVGSVPGAAAPVAGYTAVVGNLDIFALLLFFNLVFWQMPHFYSIAIFRKSDYKKARIPVLPLVSGLKTTKYFILVYLALFIFSSTLLFAIKEVPWLYISALLVINTYWSKVAIEGFKVKNNNKWAKQMFGVSLVVLLVYSLLLALDGILG